LSDSGGPGLQRSITTIPLALYGIGVTVGAGIYVLVGEVAANAGAAAPLSFLLAALIIAPTAYSYCELSVRFPRAAGEAVYVGAAFSSLSLVRLVGLLVAAAGIVSSSAVAIGAAGYLRAFIDLPLPVVAIALVLLLGAIAAWGVVQSVAFAIVVSLFEVAALVWIVVLAAPEIADPVAALGAAWPGRDVVPWIGVGSGLLLAFFAFVGFEDIVNMAEEVKEPARSMPAAIGLTLVVTTILYLAVSFVAVAAIGAGELAGQEAPLAHLYARLTGGNPAIIAAVAVASTLNTILIQMVMASRVLYGLAREGALPQGLGRVNARTRTPLLATVVVIAIIIVLALAAPIATLARATSAIILFVFIMINLALLRLKSAGGEAPEFVVPRAVPAAGALLSILVFLFEIGRLAAN
jgi:amino acid transporter